MNSLSWILYLADASDKIATVAGAAVIICSLCAAVLLLAHIVISGVHVVDRDESAGKFAAFLGPILRTFLLVIAATGVLYAATPSSSTLYLIAASEAGEAVVNAPGTKELFGDLTAVIKKRLKEELGE